jgi:hypothetical protein
MAHCISSAKQKATGGLYPHQSSQFSTLSIQLLKYRGCSLLLELDACSCHRLLGMRSAALDGCDATPLLRRAAITTLQFAARESKEHWGVIVSWWLHGTRMQSIEKPD